MEIQRKRMVKDQELELTEKVIKISRVAKVVKGGRRFSFNALSVVGDSHGHIGIGFGKANEVPDAIRKSVDNAKKVVVKINTKKNTIPHEIVGRYKTAKVILRPAYPGTGIKAGDAVRSVVEMAGIKDILSKVHGSRNQLNVVKATFIGLMQLRNHYEVAKMREIPVHKLWGMDEPIVQEKTEESAEAISDTAIQTTTENSESDAADDATAAVETEGSQDSRENEPEQKSETGA